MIDPLNPLEPFAPEERDDYRRANLQGLTKKAERLTRVELTEFGGLSDEQVDVLLRDYAIVQMGEYLWSERRKRGLDWSRWALKTAAIQVEVHRGGRAVLREPSANFKVEVYFVVTAERVFQAKRMEVSLDAGETSLFGAAPDLARYWAALKVRLAKGADPLSDGSVPTVRPEPGQPFSVEFYMSLLDAEAALKEQGHPSPAKELAKLYGENYATVRSWIARGHRRLDE